MHGCIAKLLQILGATVAAIATTLNPQILDATVFLSRIDALNNGGVFGVDGIAVFVYLDVGYSVISLKFRGIPILENSAVNGFSYIEALYSVLPEKLWNFRMNLMSFI